MKITALVPTCNRPRLLERALSSIAEQNFANTYVHIGDNSDNNESREIARSYSDQLNIKYWKHQVNIGAQANLEFLVQSVDSGLYHILSDDDLLAPGFYKNSILLNQQDQDIPLICFRTLIIDLSTNTASVLSTNWLSGTYKPSVDNLSRLSRSHFCSTSVMVNKDLIKNNPLTSDFFGSDQASMIRLAAQYSFMVTSNIGGVYIIYQPKLWSRISSARNALEGLAMQVNRLSSRADCSAVHEQEELLVSEIYASIYCCIIRESIVQTDNSSNIAESHHLLSFLQSLPERFVAKLFRMYNQRHSVIHLDNKLISCLSDPTGYSEALKYIMSKLNHAPA